MDRDISKQAAVEFGEEGDETFACRTANQWLEQAKKKPIAREMLGALWFEGELAVMFGAGGSGKSAFALQIAESIARGHSIGPFKNKVRKTVLYLDLKIEGKQFEQRYAADHAGGRAKYLKNHYTFSEQLFRSEIDILGTPRRGGEFDEWFNREVTRALDRSGAEVVIVDSITAMKGSYHETRELLSIMRGLRRLQRGRNLSMLIVADALKRDAAQGINVADLQGVRVIRNFAASIFAIGHSRIVANGRYIKHLESRSHALASEGEDVPTFSLKKIGGNFLGFEFACYASEQEQLSDIRNHRCWPQIELIKRWRDEKKTLREIAEKLGMSKSTVHRLFKMWRPPLRDEANPAIADRETLIPDDPDGVGRKENNDDRTGRTALGHDYFPGCEEFDKVLSEPRFAWFYNTECEEPDDYDVLNSEHTIIEIARDIAHEQYQKTGRFTPLVEDEDYRQFFNLPPIVDDTQSFAALHDADDDARLDNPNSPATLTPKTDVVPPIGSQGAGIDLSGLTQRLNAYGREMWIESEENGRPKIWYTLNSNGVLQRHIRKIDMVMIEKVE